MRFFRKRIPPPMDPQIPPQSKGLAIPYHIADAPRQFLIFLANYSELSGRQRELIAEWVIGYDSALVSWLLMNYGHGGVLEADAISKEVAANFYTAVDEEYRAHESSLFERLEKEMREGDA